MYQETMRKLRGTAVWSPPEMLREHEYSAYSDVYSIGIIIWELNYRCIYGRYQRPFAEYKDLMFDYQIMVASSKGQRPTMPANTPPQLAELIQSCWKSEYDDRPRCETVLEQLLNIQKEYEQNPRAWDTKKDETTPLSPSWIN